jgi:putative ABC transport system permease protein
VKYLPFVLKHLRRNWIRTASTVAAMAICIFLFCTLQSVLAEVNGMLASSNASRLVTRHAVSLVFNLPLAYGNRIQSVPGVKRVANASWFGGSLPAKKEGKAEEGTDSTTDWSNFFPNMAVEAEPYFAMYPEFQIPPDQWQAYLQDLQGAAIGRKLANKYGWKIGDRFFLESFIPPYRKRSGPFEFVVRAIFDTDLAKYPGTDTNIMFFHYKYLNEGVKPRNIGAGTYMVEINDPSQAGAVSKAIDAQFENTDAQTHTETEQAFRAGFMAMAGNLALLLNSIGLAVAFTILLVTANTMSMAVRERRTEIGVLKTLGFSSGRVMGLIVAEAVALGAIGGALGIGASNTIMWVLSHAPGIKDMLAGLGLSGLALKPFIAGLGFAVALLLGLAAGFFPAWGAYRARITDILRTV